MRVTLAAALACVLAAAGCTGETWLDLAGSTECEAGATRACTCGGPAATGRQECADHGRHWLRCECDGAATDAGTDVGIPGSDTGRSQGEGEGEGAAEGEGEGEEGVFTAADLEGDWQFVARADGTSDHGTPSFKGAFSVSADGAISRGAVWGSARELGLDRDGMIFVGALSGGFVAVLDPEALTVRAGLRVPSGVVTVDGSADSDVTRVAGRFTSELGTEGALDARRYVGESAGWDCHPTFLGGRDECDCGCGTPDPDCTGGCTEPGCRGAGCDFCFRGGEAILCAGGGEGEGEGEGGGSGVGPCRFRCSGCSGTTSCTGRTCGSCQDLCEEACEGCGRLLSCGG